jgi:hypothetical protein
MCTAGLVHVRCSPYTKRPGVHVYGLVRSSRLLIREGSADFSNAENVEANHVAAWENREAGVTERVASRA